MSTDTSDVVHKTPERPRLSVLLDYNWQDATPAAEKPAPFDATVAFDIPQRKPLKVNPWMAIATFTIGPGLVAALIVGYILGLRLFSLGITSVGLYGIVLLSEYFVQLTCAIMNRADVNRIISNRAKEVANNKVAVDVKGKEKVVGEKVTEKGELTEESTPDLLNADGDISIAVVGYREDEQAWRQCLRSLTKQTLRPNCVIGVVDGNEEPDLSMANAFVSEFKAYNAPLIHLPILLSELHQEKYAEAIPKDKRSRIAKAWHWLTGRHRPGHAVALSVARQAVIDQVAEWTDKYNLDKLDAVIFAQPHGHKRTAMFTAFAISMYGLRTRDGVFTTDSDTLVQPNALDEMLTLLRSAPGIGGVTADVKIWNRSESILARLCSARYWFAFNIERACQSLWRCVGCLSGPMSMYRTCDLDTILGPWNLQTFGGKPTTFGDDRHLTNQILAHGLHTRYTHRTWCDSESPTSFVRWVAQQTRWSKSFFRETFWFPASFAYQSPWLLMETTIQTLYPFIMVATAFHFLFETKGTNHWGPLVWIVTMFAIALMKSVIAVCISGNPWLLLFSCYGFVYFFGLLPSKIWALFTMNQTAWGTSARSTTERKRGQSFLQRSFHVGHLVVWYAAIFVGLGFFVYRIYGQPLFFLIGASVVVAAGYLYSDGFSIKGMVSKIMKTPVKVEEPPQIAVTVPVEEEITVDESATRKYSRQLSSASTLFESPFRKHSRQLSSASTLFESPFRRQSRQMSSATLVGSVLPVHSRQISSISTVMETPTTLPKEPMFVLNTSSSSSSTHSLKKGSNLDSTLGDPTAAVGPTEVAFARKMMNLFVKSKYAPGASTPDLAEKGSATPTKTLNFPPAKVIDDSSTDEISYPKPAKLVNRDVDQITFASPFRPQFGMT